MRKTAKTKLALVYPKHHSATQTGVAEVAARGKNCPGEVCCGVVVVLWCCGVVLGLCGVVVLWCCGVGGGVGVGGVGVGVWCALSVLLGYGVRCVVGVVLLFLFVVLVVVLVVRVVGGSAVVVVWLVLSRGCFVVWC